MAQEYEMKIKYSSNYTSLHGETAYSPCKQWIFITHIWSGKGQLELNISKALPVLHIFVFKHKINLCSSDWSLQFLTIK